MNTTTQPTVYETTYDRGSCSVGIVHLGYGAFHRAHQAVFVDDYMEVSGDLNWGIAAVNLRGEENASFSANSHTGEGYVLKSIAPDGATELRRVRSHLKYIDWSTDQAVAEAIVGASNVHMITITVTESGYYTDPTGALNPSDPIIAAEIAGQPGRSVYAYLSAALAHRMATIDKPITVLCCDNIRSNGKMLRNNLGAYLTHTGQMDLAKWVASNVTFPCSMVDRITPRSTPEMQQEIEKVLGPQSVQPITAEAFMQWVLEDNFAGKMPDLAQAGVTITKDVDPYEEAKIRILNGGHTCLSYLAALEGVKTFDAAMRVPELFEHFWAYETEEVLPGLTIDLPFDKLEYLGSICDRFKNRAIADTVSRICADGLAKFPIFIRPTLNGCLEQGIMPLNGIRTIASWYVFCQHSAAGRISFEYLEPAWSHLLPMLTPDGREDFIMSRQLWGDLPETYPNFADALRAGLNDMETKWPV